MSTPIATVLSVTGQAWGRDADGNLRALEPGDILLEGETLITSDNGRVRLDFGDVEPVAIGPGQTIAMLAELDVDNPIPDDEASTTDESVDALLAAIEEGEGDLLDVLDPTAAGLGGGGGGGGGGGNSFVRLARISESVDSLAFDYQPPQLDSLIDAQGESLTDQNEAPIAIDDTGVGQEDTALTGNVLSNDIDDDGDALTVVGFTINDTAYQAGETAELEGIGSLIIGSDGSYTFTPVANWNGQVPVVSYTVSDGELTDTSTLSLTVEAVNDAPVAVGDMGSGTEDTTLTGNVLDNDSDIDGDALTVIDFTVNNPVGQSNLGGDFGDNGPLFPIEQIGNSTHQAGESVSLYGIGTLTINSDGSYTFIPDDNWNGEVPTVSYTITDGEFFDTATLELNVTPVNDTPVGNDDNAADAVDDALTTPEDTALTIDPATLLVNDQDADGDDLFISAVDDDARDAQGVVVGTVMSTSDNDGRVMQITFTPNTNYSGDATFDYTVSDGAASSTATVTVDVTPVNDIPVGGDDNATDAADDALTTAEDTALNIDPQTLLANDNDVDGDTLSITGVSNASNGTVVLNTDGSITFTPDDNYNGDATFDYTVSDGEASDTATVTVDVTPVNDAPVARDDSGRGNEDSTIGGNVLTNDSDIDNVNSELTVSDFTISQAIYQAGETAELEGVGSLVVNSDGSYSFTPVDNWNGQVPAVSYTVSDGDLTDTATLNLSVTPVNDAPEALDENNSVDVGGSVTATGGQNGQGVLGNDSDSDGDPIRVSQVDGHVDGGVVVDGGSFTVDGQYGTLKIDSDGGYTYTSNLSTPVLYGFNCSDGQLNGNVLEEFALNGEAQHRVSVTDDGVGVTGGEDNHPTPDQINETGDVLIADLGTSVSSATFGVARLFDDESGGELGQWFAYDAGGNLIGSGKFGPDNVDYQGGSNHIGTVTITVDDVVGEFQYLAFEGLDYQNGGDNAENDGGDYLITGITVQDVFDYTIVDGKTGDASATLTIDSSASLIGYQTPPNSAAEPEAVNDKNFTNEDTTLSVDADHGVLANDTGNTLKVTSFIVNDVDYQAGEPVGLEGVGSLHINSDGSYSFAPAGGFEGDAVIDYILTDADGDTASATLTVTVAADSTPTIYLASDGGSVNEAGLDGGNAANANTETTMGEFSVATSNDALASLTITDAAGKSIDVAGGGTVVGEHGTLTVTQGQNGDYNWNYTLSGATLGDNVRETFALVATDSDGDTSDDNLTIAIVDDVPYAESEAITTGEDTFVTYNVIDNDSQGADGATLSAASLAEGSEGAGTVSIYAETGEITFTPAAGFEGDVVIDYILTDGDGDQSSAQLIVAVAADSEPTITFDGLDGDTGEVDEAGLDDGSDVGNNAHITSGNFAISTGNDTLAGLVIGEIDVTDGGTVEGEHGSLVVTQGDSGDYSWTYTLTDATDGDYVSESFNLVATDNDGSTASNSLVITIVDDMPIVQKDTASHVVSNTDIPDILRGEFDFTEQPTDGLLRFDGFTVTAQGFKNENNGELEPTNIAVQDGAIGVSSKDSPYHNLVGEVGYRIFDDGGLSEELVFTLDEGTVAYSLGIEFAMMFGGEKEVGEVEFYRDGEWIATKSFSSDADDGNYAANFEVQKGGFDRFVLRATDNGTDSSNDNSDFAIRAVTFGGSQTPTAIGYATGEIDVDYGADDYGALIFTGMSGLGEFDVSNSGQTLTATNAQDELLFQVELTPETGKWEFFQYQPLTSAITLQFAATDGDGDRVEGSINVETLGSGSDGFYTEITAHTVGSSNNGTLASVAGLKDTDQKSASVHKQDGFFAVDHSGKGNSDDPAAIDPKEALLFDLVHEATSATFEIEGDVSSATYHLYNADGERIGDAHALEGVGIVTLTSDTPFAHVAFLGGEENGHDPSESSFAVKPIGLEIAGTNADETLVGIDESNRLLGPEGNDTLYGGLGADTFAWEFGDQGSEASPAQDTVMDFNAGEGDKLDLSDLLQDRESGDDISRYIQATQDGDSTTLHISTSGNLGNSGTDQTIDLAGIDMGGKSSDAFVDDLIAKGQIDI